MKPRVIRSRAGISGGGADSLGGIWFHGKDARGGLSATEGGVSGRGGRSQDSGNQKASSIHADGCAGISRFGILDPIFRKHGTS
jgi:hypothetical protein